MSNTAQIIKFRAREEREEQRMADTEDGYTRLANMLLEEYSGADLTKRQFKVLLAVLRLTYGWNKTMDRISNSQIAEIAKLPEKRCSEARVELVEMNVLLQRGRQIGPNKNVSDWRIPQFEGNSPKLEDGKSPKLRDSNPLKQGNTKDIIPNTVKTTDTSADADDSPVPQDNQIAQEENPFQQKQKKPALSCEAVLAVYHEVLPEAKAVRLLSDKRRNQIRTFWKKATKITRQLDGQPFTLDSWRQYLEYISGNCRWMLEDRQDTRSGRVWHRKGLEYFLNDETYLLVREGAKDDR